MRKSYFFAFFLILGLSYGFGQSERPKIGLTLSGGGAKGLAHIGILKAIDSAGVKIDYITGTSMGAVVGSLYAIGYSGKQIEKLARNIDWGLLLSNEMALKSLAMEEKGEYGKYAIELPIIKRKLSLPIGVLQGQELWFKFAELYKPVRGISDFASFSIPFKCVATDIITGKAVVFDSGDISTAVRASMAIPSAFTPVDLDGMKLVDGGMLRNFPVRDVKEMGADIVIGSSLSSGLYSRERLNNVIDILLQLAFFKENDDFLEEVPLCDYYVEQTLEGYSMASFGDSETIIDLGIEKGESIFPEIKHLADSLDAIYGKQIFVEDRLPKNDSVLINSHSIIGLESTTETFFIHAIKFGDGKYYTEAAISDLIRKVYGTRYYSSINFKIIKHEDNTNEVVFRVVENPLTYAKLGLHYNDFSGISALLNFTTRDFFTKYSRSLVTYNIGENLRLLGEHMQYFGLQKNVALIARLQVENFKFNTYTDLSRTGQYKQFYTVGELKGQYAGNRDWTGGIGIRQEYIRFKPLVESRLEASGKNTFLTSFAFLKFNTFDRPIYPNKGLKLEAELGSVFNQKPDIEFLEDGVPITDLSTLGIDYENYQRLSIMLDAYQPIAPKWTFNVVFQAGLNFNYSQNLVNNFQVGGLTRTFRNQITFAGYNEGVISTASVATLGLGVNCSLFKNGYLTFKSNGLVSNFTSREKYLRFDTWLTGHAVSFAYLTPIGALEFSIMYGDQSNDLGTYVNFGIPF
ncbi:patatin-like phospholipase family protein [Arcticibacterium luteifluviistationis]|uniref:PNPLA domain-containing protein n=1 Tax=Arcticibacterium luteifluviistationis TaxID=1784714 RepID=A0A2Z4G7K2_9BACT|nr:patatin-like phospholipase family protein [Arcticibacterium luteifluviistationis]AWV97151.1 hypothetical protein DJ013_02760 [Arcticibacterium luteifluviistationis]